MDRWHRVQIYEVSETSDIQLNSVGEYLSRIGSTLTLRSEDTLTILAIVEKNYISLLVADFIG
jgi:hypothetical protein